MRPGYIGRNYLQDTYWHRSANIMTIEDGVITSICSHIYPRVSNQIGLYLDIKGGEQWTLSFDVLVPDEEDINISLNISNPSSDSSTGTGFIGWLSTPKYTKGEWSHIKTSFTAKDDILETTRIYFQYHTTFHDGVPKDAEKYWMKLKNVKLERGSVATPWVPALESGELNFIKHNLVNGTSSGWSDWVKPPYYNKNNIVGRFSSPLHIDYDNVDYVTAGVELEFKDVTLTDKEDKEHTFHFTLQGAVNNEWDNTKPNPFQNQMKFWNSQIPENNKIYTFLRKGYDVSQLTGQYIISISWRINYWATGQFRYRQVFCKAGDLSNPIWSPSEMDIANTNIIKTTKESQWTANMELADISEIEIFDCPNPYITSGYNIKYSGDSGVVGITMSGESNILNPGDTIIISCYIRFNQSLVIDESKQGLYLQTHIDPEELEGDRFNYSYFSKIVKIGEWVRVSAVVNIVSQKTLNSTLFTRGLDIDVCGFKAEYGNKLTAWVPYVDSATTLEIQYDETYD